MVGLLIDKIQCILGTYWVSQKKYTNLVRSSDLNLALINGLSFSKCSLIVNLDIYTLFISIGALGAEKFVSRKLKFASISFKPELWCFGQFLKHIA